MPIYEYQGKQYDISSTDPTEAKNKILAYLGKSEAPTPVAKPEPEQTSAVSAFGKSAAESIVPTTTGLAAAGKGARLGFAVPGPLPVKVGGAIVGGLGGGVLGGMAGEEAQQFLGKYIPDEFKQELGFGKEQRALETEQHPYASFAGQLAPNLAFFTPGRVAPIVDQAGKTILGSGAQRAVMAGAGGGLEAGSELIQEGKIDPTKVGMAALFQGVAATPTKLGGKIFGEAVSPKEKIVSEADKAIDESFTGDALVSRQLSLLETKRRFVEQDLTELQQRATTSDLPVEDVILKQQKETELERINADIEKLGGTRGKVEPTVREQVPTEGKVAGEIPPTRPLEEPTTRPIEEGGTTPYREVGVSPESEVPAWMQKEDYEMLGPKPEDVIQQTSLEKAVSDYQTRISDLEEYRQSIEDTIQDYHENPNRNSPMDLADLESQLANTETQLEKLYDGQAKVLAPKEKQPTVTMEQRHAKADAIIAESIASGATPEATARRLSSAFYSAEDGIHYVGNPTNRKFISDAVSTLNKLVGQNDKLIVVNAPELSAGRYTAVGNTHILYVSDVRKSTFDFLNAVPEATRSKAAMIANIGHEYGHYYHNKLVQAYGNDSAVLKNLESVFNKFVKDSAVTKAETVAAVPLSKGYLGDTEYARVTEHFNKFPEFVAEAFNRAILHDKLPDNAFLRSLYTGLRKITNKVFGELEKLGITVSKDDFTSQYFTEYFKQNREFFERTGESMIDNGIRLKVEKQLADTGKPNLPSAQQINDNLESFYKMDGFNDFEPVNVVKTVEEQKKVRDLGWVSTKIAANAFGSPQLVNILKQSPVIRAVYQAIRNADTEASRIVKSLMEGVTSMKDWEGKAIKKGFITTLKKFQDVDSPAIAMQRLKNSDFAALEQVFRKGFDEGLEYPQALAKYGDMLNDEQRHAFTVFSELFTKQYEEVVKLQQQMGKKNILPKRKGWYPAVRKGDFHVQMSVNGVPVYRQHVRTAAEAERLAKLANESGKFKGLEVEHGKTNDTRIEAEQRDWLSTAIMMELQKRGERTGLEAVEALLDKIYTKGGKLGKHHEQRMNILGYKGTEIFGDVNERGLSFKDAIDSSVKEYAGSLRKMMISRNTDQILKTPEGLDQTHPNTMEVANLMRDMATSQVDSRLSSFDKMVNNTFDTIFQKVFGRESRLPVYERISGLMTHLFYMTTLTMKPAFWIGQALTSPTSIRHILREANTASALISAGKGTMNLFRPSEEFAKCVHWLSQNTETFHPQFANELTSFKMPELLKEGSLANKVVNTITGEIPSQAADSFSRYWTAAMMFEHYKSKGLTGKQLYNAVANATDTTMVQYGQRYRAPYLKKLGIVGEAMAPLHTFSQAQWGNLVADLKLAVEKGHNVKPLVATFLTTIMLGGVIGAPLVAEYEIIRKALGLEDELPSVIEWASSNNSRFLTHGVLSYSGFDLGSTMRWNPIVSGMVEGNSTIADLFPAAKFAGKTVGNLATFAKAKAGGDVSEAEYRAAVLGIVPKGPLTGLVEDVKFGATERAMVPTGGRGYGLVPQTDAERAAAYMGTRTMESALESKQYGLLTEADRRRSKDVQKQIDIATDALKNGDTKAYANALEELGNLGVKPDSVKSQIESAIANRSRGLLERFALGATGKGTSYEQQRKLQNIMEYIK